ncbi:Hypothetical predicted protein [Olea europaea subsp. europaea]|uniref:Uncharacterized protein n=1 Tax=Olea europaea subsp. europaea TaxID=158383 RepID=A0A8S0RI88_OLEEU|nr:Hypothetical predicted protein [Olea europaea subsp. europaea]
MAKTRSCDRKSQKKKKQTVPLQAINRTPDETPKTSIGSRRRKSNNIEVRYVVPSDDEIVAPYMEDILYKKPLQPHVREDVQFGDTGNAAQSPNRPRLLMITDGCKGHSSDVEDDDDDNNDFVDTPPKRKKTPSHFYPPTKEHTTSGILSYETRGA